MSNTRYESCNIGRYDIEIRNELLNSRIYWTKVVSSENESLLTKNTRHTFYEVQYALEGHIGMTVGKENYIRIDESDFIVIPPDTWHQVVDDSNTGARLIMAFAIAPVSERIKEKVRYLNCLEVQRETPVMRTLISLILEKNKETGTLGDQIVGSLVETFLMEILDIQGQNDENGSGMMPEEKETGHRVAAIREYIRSCHGIDLQVSDISRRFGISERHLNRMFHSVTGKSTREAINYEKLKRIEEYIVSTELSLGEIAGVCGFCDEYAMNKFFKRYNSTTLSDFRKISRVR